MTSSAIENPSDAAGTASLAGKYLTFSLGDESYGIPVLRIREIIRIIPITAVPLVPCYIKGVINLRGKVIPVLDLRVKFALPHAPPTDLTCIVVVQAQQSPQNNALIGLTVDSVEEVAHIAARDIEETPDFGTKLDSRYIVGMAKVKGVVKALLDISQIVSPDTMESALSAPHDGAALPDPNLAALTA